MNSDHDPKKDEADYAKFLETERMKAPLVTPADDLDLDGDGPEDAGDEDDA